MAAAGYFYLAVLILLLLPVVVLPWEGRRTPDWLYLLMASCGLAGAWVLGGPFALVRALAVAAACFALAGLAVTVLRARTRLRVLTGGHIKLLGAGATWLGVGGTLAMMVLTVFLLFLIAVLRLSGSVRHRPDASVIVAIAIVSVAMQHYATGM